MHYPEKLNPPAPPGDGGEMGAGKCTQHSFFKDLDNYWKNYEILVDTGNYSAYYGVYKVVPITVSAESFWESVLKTSIFRKGALHEKGPR